MTAPTADSETQPGRRSALLALAILAPVPSLGVLAGAILWPGPVGQACWAVGKAVLYGLPVLWLRFVDRRPLSWSPPRRGGFGTGALLGLAIAAVIYLTWRVAGRDGIDPAALREVAASHGFDTKAAYLGVALYIVLVNSLLEEYVFRWFFFTRCEALLRPGPALVAAALLFTVHHTLLLIAYAVSAPLVALASLGVFVGGLVWSWCYHRFGSIWPGYLSHAIADVAILVVGYEILFG